MFCDTNWKFTKTLLLNFLICCLIFICLNISCVINFFSNFFLLFNIESFSEYKYLNSFFCFYYDSTTFLARSFVPSPPSTNVYRELCLVSTIVHNYIYFFPSIGHEMINCNDNFNSKFFYILNMSFKIRQSFFKCFYIFFFKIFFSTPPCIFKALIVATKR